MHLEKLLLVNFKNYSEADITFSKDINCFVGGNGGGKTNLLDAIHYLSLCKSFSNPLDSQNIAHGSDFFVVQGSFILNEKKEKIYCGLKKGKKKQFKRNKKEYSRLADHIGFLPVVMISPEDNVLILQGSDIRRKLIDSIISQLDKSYLDDLIAYNRVLLQRNALLKRFAETRNFDEVALEVWNTQMIDLGNKIFVKRKAFIDDFIPEFQRYYEFITGGSEKVNINYLSQLRDGDFAELLKAALEKDKVIQYSSVGIHKDDLQFDIGDYPIKKMGSQGQQKSFVIALKLAQFDFIKSAKDFLPILLLDDIFDKLDEDRVQKLMELVSQHNFGQIFITHTHRERISGILDGIEADYKLFEIQNGAILKDGTLA